MNKNLKLALSIALIPLLIAGIFTYQTLQKTRAYEPRVVKLFPQRRPMPEFALHDSQGAAWTHKDLQGRWSILFFGYTHCPDVCPMTLADLAKIYRQLPESTQDRLQVVFVSVDPDRDTNEVLQKYAAFFHPEFRAVTGDDQMLNRLARALGAIYFVSKEGGDYVVEHSGKLFLVDPQGRRAGLFDIRTPPPESRLPATELVEDLRHIIH
jgi:protein SCO1/2